MYAPFAAILMVSTALPQSSLAITGDKICYLGHAYSLH